MRPSRRPAPLHTPAAHTRADRRRPRAMRAAALAAAALVLAGAAVAARGGVDPGAAAAALAGADPQLIAAAVALYVLGQTVSGLMWLGCQDAGGVRGIAAPTGLGIHWIARGACELLPAALGEAVRVGLVRRHPSGRRAGAWRIAGGVAGYKAIDAVVTSALVLGLALALPMPGPAAALRWTALAMIAAMVGVALAWRLGGGRLIARAVPRRAAPALRRLAGGAAVLGDAPAARTAALLGLGAALCRVLSLGALLMALGAPPQAAALAFCAIVLAGAIPGAPGGAGARELVLVPALALAHGVPGATALAFSVAVQAISLGASVALAMVALAIVGPRLRCGDEDAVVAPIAGVMPEGPASG